MSFSKEINTAIARNLKLKSGILVVIFTLIFLLQIIVIFVSNYFDAIFTNFQSKWLMILGPTLLLMAVASEVYTFRLMQQIIEKKAHLSFKVTYLIVFIETSFPSIILLFVFFVLGNNNQVSAIQLLNSPPVSMYYIMILLSSLMLDYKISVFAGFIAAIEYFIIARYLLGHDPSALKLDLLNSEVKAAFIFISGIVAGFVSYKTREAVLSSLQAKDDLINRLDHLVHIKTEEIRKQKNELEEKNKDIIDSMNYAQRIQQSQLPTETYIVRSLNRLRGK